MSAKSSTVLQKRKLPKLMACMTKASLENYRNKEIYNMEMLDAKGIRRRKMDFHDCLILELRESGFYESASYLQDLIYDNIQLVADDDIGIVVDLRKNAEYLEHISVGLRAAEKFKDKGETKKESTELLNLALFYAEKGKGILWLAEKLFLAAIAVSSRYLLDGGRQKAVCTYHYATFLLEKFPGGDTEEPFNLLTQVRDSCIGKDWLLYEKSEETDTLKSSESVFSACAVQLHGVLINSSRAIRKLDTGKAERLARLAERRANDAKISSKAAEAIIEIGICQLMMNNLNNAKKTFERAHKLFKSANNVEGICETKMHSAAVHQRIGDHEYAAQLLTEMGDLAMRNGLRRQLGRALHLLGELHLRSEKPELGTLHLSEAFMCFMGYMSVEEKSSQAYITEIESGKEQMDQIYKDHKNAVFVEEAEVSRLMMAVSAGQELMADYFNLVRDANQCAVSQMKIIEWKLNKTAWWLKTYHEDLMPCMCPNHNRTPLDILQMKLDLMAAKMAKTESTDFSTLALGRNLTIQDMGALRSAFL